MEWILILIFYSPEAIEVFWLSSGKPKKYPVNPVNPV
jgi:hypothetical protein